MAMPLIPYKRVSISTSLSIDKAASVLAGHLVTPKSSKSWFFPSYGSRDPRKFSGKRYENGFRIWRNIWSLQSTGSIGYPITYVRLKEAHHGTLVDTVITLHPLTGVTVLFLMCLVGWHVCRYFAVLISTGVFDSGLVATLSFLLILYSSTMLVFNREVDLTERFLSGIYDEHLMRA
jgi:hypothetical protein